LSCDTNKTQLLSHVINNGLTVEDAQCIIHAFVAPLMKPVVPDKGRNRNLSNFCRILASGVLTSGGEGLVIQGHTKAMVEKLSQDPSSLVIAPEFQNHVVRMEKLLNDLHVRVMDQLDLKIYPGTSLLTVINNVRKKTHTVDGKRVAKNEKDAYLLELYALLSINMAPMKDKNAISTK